VSALVIDTSSWISYFAGRGSDLVELALAESRVYLSPVVAAELLSGKLNTKERDALESLLSDLPLCPNELQHWFRVGKLRSALIKNGLSVSTPDAHIAQCALDLDAELLSEDRIFNRIAEHHRLRLI
jgi:predicted nucleic acid-binding protein